MQFKIANIEEILLQEDIEGLLELGAPQDEYISEAEQIANTLNEYSGKISLEDKIKVIQNVWNQNFGPFSDKELKKRIVLFKRVAEKLE